MKKKIVIFFFLISFTRCSKDDPRPFPFLYDTGSGKSVPTSHQLTGGSGMGTSKTHFPVLSVSKKDRKKNKYHGRKAPEISLIPASLNRNYDSSLINRLSYLRFNHIEIDLNEPLSRKFLFSPMENPPNLPFITFGQESVLSINFDNDILDYTDRFYTNGIRFDLITPWLRGNPTGKLMIPYWGPGKNYYGMTLVQNMYTPSTTKIGGILYGDRPYSAYLYLGSYKITLDPFHHFRQTSELDAGIIGPKSYGEWVQRTFHNSVPTNHEPLGWEYQIQNALVLNYSMKMEKGILNDRSIEVLLISTAEAGTLYTNMSGGFHFRTGWMNPYFSNIGIAKKQALHKAGLRNFQFVFFVKGAGKVVGYDATLEGGLFNRSSSYILPGKAVSRLVFQSSTGVTLSYNGFRLDLEQFLLSPDFHNGWWHKWVHLSLAFCL